MVDLPAAEVGTADVPVFALAVRRQDERALARANQHPHLAHHRPSIVFAQVHTKRFLRALDQHANPTPQIWVAVELSPVPSIAAALR